MFPSLSGYNPILNTDLPQGYTAEYYGDDIIYIGYKGKVIAEIWGESDVRMKCEKGMFEKVQRILTGILDDIRAIESNYPVEEYADKHSGNR